MESAFTGLVRKHTVPFKLNTGITPHNTIVAVLLIFHHILDLFNVFYIRINVYLLCTVPFVSPTPTGPAARSGLGLANAIGIKG